MKKKLVMNLAGYDTGGQCHRLKYLFDTYSSRWLMRCSVKKLNYINYPFDLYWTRDEDNIKSLLGKASVYHIHSLISWYPQFLKNDIPKLIHQHGRMGLTSLTAAEDKKYNLFRVVSTGNLLRWVGDDWSRWLPAPAPSGLYERDIKPNDGKIRIVQSPTVRERKGTEFIIKTVDKLKRIHPEVELVLIENKTWSETMKIKSICDIGIDQFALWYGNSSLEYWELGMPSLCGMDKRVRDMTVDYFGYEPWYFIDEDNFYSVLDEMICDPEYRKKYADLGRKHLERYHSGLNVVKKTESLYNQLLK